ncbi:MAG: hypothetical protein DRJ66_02650 [Thermoprotei archaeon]|nr:MAG: hypothetical protein DRJ66_02650 [Thermoprotei archaeon]RLF20346.1 MAG: hypothetical protein DRZ82_02750 [Thermoprotei archaeon]
MSALSNLVYKELKELFRDPKFVIGMIVVSLVIFPLLSKMFTYSIESTKKATTITIGIVDFDKGYFSKNLKDYLKSVPNVKIVESPNISTLTNSSEEISAIIVIPKGFSHNITSNSRAYLRVFTVIRRFSLIQGSSSASVISILNSYKRYLSTLLLKMNLPDVDPLAVLDPLLIQEGTFIKGELFNIPSSTLFQLMTMYYVVIPYSMMFLLIIAIQIAATSMASEKERKTLETLLTLPISRSTIFLGKLIGSAIVALIGSAAYMAGFMYYMKSLIEVQAQGLASYSMLSKLGLLPSKISFILLGAIVVMTLLSSISLALCLGSFAESVQSAQSISGMLAPFIFLPSLFTLFVDISLLPLPLKLILYAIPFTHISTATRAALENAYGKLILILLYLTTFTAIVLYITARLFSMEEKILASRLFRRRMLRKKR